METPNNVEPGQEGVQAAAFPSIEGGAPAAGERGGNLDMLMDLSLPVSIELGRTTMSIRSILDVQRGSIVEFDRLANEPVDILVNGKKMAEGEVVVVDKHFGVRITTLATAAERMTGLGR